MSRGILPGAARSQRWFWSTLSTVVLATIVVVVPIGLCTAGGFPLGHGAYGQGRKAFTSRQPFDPLLVAHWLERGAVVLAWILWVWMTLCIVIEVRARITGRSSTRLPASRTMQSVAACLVGTALAFAGMGREMPTPRAPAPVTGSAGAGPAHALRVIDDYHARSEVSSPVSEFDRSPERPSTSSPGGPDRWPQATGGTANASSGAESPVLGVAGSVSVEAPDAGTVPGAGAGAAAAAGAGAGGRSSASGTEMKSGSQAHTGASDRWPTSRGSNGSTTVSVNGRGARERSPRPGGSGAPLPEETVHQVMPRETLWSIAEEELGSALRWRELAALNYGVEQQDGEALTREHWITSGWKLRLPGGQVHSDPVDSELPRTRETRLTTSPSARQRARAGEAVSGPRASQSGVGRVPSDTDGVRGIVSAEASGAPAGHGPGAPVDPAVPAVPAVLAVPAVPAVPVVPVGGGIVGVGVVDLIDRLRRVQQRHRKSGSFIRMPDQSRRLFEQRLRMGDGRSALDAIDRSVRLLARSWSGEGIESPPVRGVKVSSDVVELVVDGLGPVPRIPPPFTPGVGGSSLVVERSALARPLHLGIGSREERFPIPTLVTAGHAVDGLVMVNLEALGSLIVDGDPSECDGVVRALALELATSQWADQFDVVLVGFGAEFGRFDRVRAASDVPALIHELWCRRFRAEALLRNASFHSFAEARCFESTGTWDPLVVICGPAAQESQVAELLEVGADAAGGMAVVAAGGDGEASHTLRLSTSGDSPSLELIGSVVFPQQIAVEELADLDAILAAANDRESVTSPEGSGTGSPRPGRETGFAVAFESATGFETREVTVPVPRVAQAPPMPSYGESGTHEVEVAVLGPVEIRGAAREFTRAWAEELVVYLALHPNGASSDAWATALWPDRLMAPSSLHSTASVARRSLGQGRDGHDHLPRSHGRLTLAPTVGTDWDRFVVLAATDQSDNWRSALELVRGRPFEGLRSSDWPVLEGIGPSIESTVVDLSGRLAGDRLRAGDPRGAEWAARRGLLVSPYDERLYRMLMRAADLGGNPAGVEAAMAQLVGLVADDIEPLDSVHPSTMELYRSLTRRRTQSATTR